MCQPKSAGGHRCRQSPTARARRALSAARARSARSGLDGGRLDRAIERLDAAKATYGPIVTPLDLDLPDGVHSVLDSLRAKRLTGVLVGGTVRDAINGNAAPKDFDIEVYGTSVEKLARTLRAEGHHVDEVGQAFGVLKIRTRDGHDLDISVPRRDSLAGVGHRGIAVETDENMDVITASSRRDFTMNALMFDDELGVCIDPHGGLDDLRAGVLRHVSDAYGEDPLRPLRGFQFAARHSMTMAPETVALSASLRPRFGELPVERVRGEWMKFYTKGIDPAAGLRVLRDIGWNDTVPGVTTVNTDDRLGERLGRAHQVAVRDGLHGDERVHLIAGVMAEGMDESTRREFVRHTVESHNLGRAARGLAGAHLTDDTPTGLRRFARALHADQTSIEFWARKMETSAEPADVALAARVLGHAREMRIADGPRPDALLGRHLLEASTRKPGPWMGETLRAARQAQDEGEFADLNGALEWFAGRAE